MINRQIKDEINILNFCKGQVNVIQMIESFEITEDPNNQMTYVVMELAENSFRNHISKIQS